jgi:NAD(P)-dependent dehydrogenase (short-subunit alcohol dehydrogenase family)
MHRRRHSRGIAFAAAGALAGLAWEAVQRSREIDLAGRVALVTGGSRGLGLLIARELVREGCRVSVCARDEVELEAARRDLEGRGGEVLAVPCDVSRREEVDAWVRRTHAHFGAIHLLFNNASVIQVGPLDAMTLADFEEAMAVNYWGTVHATRAVLPHLRAAREGRIVNVTSIGGRVAVPHLLPYDAAKFAVVGFSEGLRAELAGEGIAVTTVVPGLMRTGSPVNAFFKGKQALEYTWFSLASATPLTTMSAGRAARRIVRAARRGEAEVTLTWQARLLRLAHALFPAATLQAMALTQRALPENAPGGAEAVRGMKLSTPASPSPATALMNRAARENNEYGGRPRPSPEHARGAGLRE